MASYDGKVMLTFGCMKGNTFIPDKRARERFAQDVLRLSRCEAYRWIHSSTPVEWRIADITVEPAHRPGAKSTRFTITLMKAGNEGDQSPFVASAALEAFEQMMLKLAHASTNFLSPSSAYYGKVGLELTTWLL